MPKSISQLFKEDQAHTGKWIKKHSKKEYILTNRNLLKNLDALINKNEIVSGIDHFRAAMIFHHGLNISSSRKALIYAQKAYILGYKKGKWLIASATDRLLQFRGRPQKFGTQVKNMYSKRLELYKINPKTTDKERKEYGLPTLKQLKKYYGIK